MSMAKAVTWNMGYMQAGGGSFKRCGCQSKSFISFIPEIYIPLFAFVLLKHLGIVNNSPGTRLLACESYRI